MDLESVINWTLWIKLLEVLSPALIAAITAYLISKHTIRKHIFTTNIDKIQEFEYFLTNLRGVDVNTAKSCFANNSSEEAVKIFTEMATKGIDAIKKYRQCRAYIGKKYRKNIDAIVTDFEKEHQIIINLYCETKDFNADSLEQHGIDPVKKVVELGKLAMSMIEIMNKNVTEYIDNS